jgi:hypothetical protein
VSRFLRWENSEWPLFRVLYAADFAVDGSGPWTIAEYWNAAAPAVGEEDTSYNGIEFRSCVRQALPGIGECLLTLEYGLIDGVTVTPLDLKDKHIRVQAARRPTNMTTAPVWRTIWVGRCEWQDDAISGGADVLRGTRTYHCVDLLRTYLAAYPMDRHAHYLLTGGLAYGHPGYNYDKSQPDVTVGNKDGTDAAYAGPDSTSVIMFATTDATAGAYRAAWTDAQAVVNAMLLRRETGDPIFDLDDPAGFLSDSTAIRVNETETAWDIVTRVCSRARGKGMAYLDWEDDSATPTGALDVKLRVRPQFYDTVTYTYPAGTTNTITGADAAADHFVRVDVQNDHRLVDDAFQLRETTDSAVDQLTTESERIEVVVTASGDDETLADRWRTELYTAWNAADDDVKKEDRFRPVLQCFGLLRTAGISYKNGDGAGTARIDWWTNADGYLYLPSPTVAAPEAIEVMDDLPLYEGYDYSGATPAPAVSAAADGKPRRRKPLVTVRVAAGRFKKANDFPTDASGGCQTSIDDDGIWVEWTESDAGKRNIVNEYLGTDADSLTLTLGLRMPQRARFVSTAGTARRKRTVRVPDLHLWIAHAGAIWDIDGSDTTDDGHAPKRIGGTMSYVSGTTDGKILRDDRAKLAKIHYLTWEWYRSDSGRRSATWALRDCGLLPSWTDIAGTAQLYPKLGQVVKDIQAAGTTFDVKTPISRVTYDNDIGVTTWQTDWTEFDYGSA